ncbi:zinc finger B-box domain-containing protein 1 isoform X2 [Ascaphus truei]
MCLECGEDYCSTCFAKIHQKGALKLHRTMPVQGRSPAGKLDVSHQLKKELNCDESREKLGTDKEISVNLVSTGVSSSVQKQNVSGEVSYSVSRKSELESGGSLLYGTFNEEKSAKSFNEALMEWRNEVHDNQERDIVVETKREGTGNSEAQTILTVIPKPLEVEFKEIGLSYLEKLMVKKHRRTPVNHVSSKQLPKCRYSPTTSLAASDYELDECEGLTAEEMEDHEHYVALFQPEEYVQTIVIQESALNIVELDTAPEEELEETTSFVVSEVETNEISDQKSSPDSESTNSAFCFAKKSAALPVQAGAKKRRSPLRPTFFVGGENPLMSARDTSITCTDSLEDHLLTTSRLKDSKSMEYKSFNDNQSLDPNAAVNVSKEFKRIALRGKSTVSKYQDLEEFFILDVDPNEVRLDHCPSLAFEHNATDEQIIFEGDSHWRPESSFTEYADDLIVQDIVAKAQAQFPSHFVEHSINPRESHQSIRQKQLTGGNYRRSFSAKPTCHTPESGIIARPSSTAARPVSRAASEISEIESIDSTDKDDLLLEDADDQKWLAVLEKELHALRSHSGGKETLHQLSSQQPFSCSKKFTDFNEKSQITNHTPKNSSPRHAAESVESVDGESESDNDETLQDKLYVLSLQ